MTPTSQGTPPATQPTPVSTPIPTRAEYRPDGSVVYSINGRGGVCIECHSRQAGPQNDLVRTFERQQ